MSNQPDPYKNLRLCTKCEGYWCNLCEVHWDECSCPGPHDQESVDVEEKQ